MQVILALTLVAPPAGLHVLVNPPPLPSLIQTINQSITNLCDANSNTLCLSATLGTNQALWTWPIQLSFIGTDAPDGYSHPLITPNFVVANAHYGAQNWTGANSFLYHDTNGVQHSIPFTGMHFILGDLVLCELVSNATDVVIPEILPPDYTNYFPNHSPVGLDLFWFHHNVPALEHCRMNSVFPSGAGPLLDTMSGRYSTALTNGGAGPTPGDSGSPVMTVINGKAILLFCQTDGGGCGVSDLIFYDNIIRYCHPQLADLSGFRTYP